MHRSGKPWVAPHRGADERLAALFHKFLNDLLPILSVKAAADNQGFNWEIHFSEISWNFYERVSQQDVDLIYVGVADWLRGVTYNCNSYIEYFGQNKLHII